MSAVARIPRTPEEVDARVEEAMVSLWEAMGILEPERLPETAGDPMILAAWAGAAGAYELIREWLATRKADRTGFQL